MAGTGTGAALTVKIAARLEGTVGSSDWDLDLVTGAPITLPTKAVYAYTWATRRERASGALHDGSIDSQIEKALKTGSPAASLEAAIRAAPQEWLVKLTARPLPAWHFAETCTETCDTCTGSCKVRCGGCSGSGKVNCATCSGTAKVREPCSWCSGRGYNPRTRQVQHQNGNYVETRTETYTETCWHCTGAGYNHAPCQQCNNGTVSCRTCAGSGQVSCGDCGGRGNRLYRHDREIVVSSSLTVTGARAGHDGLRETALGRWDAVLASSGVHFEQLACGDVESEGMTATAQISIPTATGRLRIHGEGGEVWALGDAAEVHDGEPVLAKGLKLPEPRPNSPWPSVAQHLSGTRLLRETLTLLNTSKGSRDVRREQTAAAVLAEYGWLLDRDGAMAVAMAAASGVGALRGDAQKRVWLAGWSITAVIVAVLTWLSIRTIISTPHPGPELVTLLGGAAGLALTTGVGAALLARRNTQVLATALGVEGAHVSMRPGKLFLTIAGMTVLAPLAIVAALFAAYFAGWPADYRRVIDGETPPSAAPDGQG